jgi:FkbM family methyltransferase
MLVTHHMTRVAREHLSARQVEQLRKLRDKLSIASFGARALTLLPTRPLVRLKEEVRLTGKLDYPRAEILMNLDSSAQLARLRSCEKEPETVEWIESHIQPGEVLYDIGANVGSYSFVSHAATGGNCTVYAFEPSFSTFAALCQNVLLNNCSATIIPMQVVLSDETKLLKLHYHDVMAGSALHRVGAVVDGAALRFVPAYTQTILGYRLDDLVSQFALAWPNHIKLDVDGAELDVLRGAPSILERPSVRSLLVEVDEERHPSGEIPKLLQGKGFTLRARHQRGRCETLANYIFERS